ncbi:hypothetical protein CL6EHI_092310 [Entamoeba histolytica]|uniref:Uncharacterized protein n=2 Tax=Entamoeba histolytica TaxID=5759 RepID=C4LUZ5_ENTH1|nr:hypothetical protein EHI_092310 [Entamoeba histolytica HM-1:IMSS]EAL43085.2 hypothetical protein EHI_092310 [Entamoeba histolytica HM-1:IMSS]GAT92464.1 hypothetical protein CL6EHI_092310 [Entamoeba histolytica]|eukprot:XP_648475.2 hypothetical protein EHI_092310 [Entamoeba histolytica HM-1:IMSS]
MHSQNISLFKDINDISKGLSDQFRNIISKCTKPHFICICGDQYIDENTNIHQIINGISSNDYLNAQESLKSSNKISTSESNNCNVIGPILVSDIVKRNNLEEQEFQQILNDELFFIEIEKHKLTSSTTPNNIVEILSILQLSSIRIIYNNNEINAGILEDISSFDYPSCLLELQGIRKEGKRVICISPDIQTITEKENETILKESVLNKQKHINNDLVHFFSTKSHQTNCLCFLLPSYSHPSPSQIVCNIYKEQMKCIISEILHEIPLNCKSGSYVLSCIELLIELFKSINELNINTISNEIQRLFKKKYVETISSINIKLVGMIYEMNLNERINVIENQSKIKSRVYQIIENEFIPIWDILHIIYGNQLINELFDSISITSKHLEEFILKEIQKIIDDLIHCNDFRLTPMWKYLTQLQIKEQFEQENYNTIINNYLAQTLTSNQKILQFYSNKKCTTVNEVKHQCIDTITLKTNEILNGKQQWRDVYITVKNYYHNLINTIDKEVQTKELSTVRQVELCHQYYLGLFTSKSETYTTQHEQIIFNKNDYNDILQDALNELNALFDKKKQIAQSLEQTHLKEELEQKKEAFIKKLTSKSYYIMPCCTTRYVLDAKYSDFTDGQPITLYWSHGNQNQSFQFIQKNNLFQIKIGHNGFLVHRNDSSEGSVIHQWNDTTSINSLWKIIENHDGTISFLSASNESLAFTADSNELISLCHTCYFTCSDYQKFKLLESPLNNQPIPLPPTNQETPNHQTQFFQIPKYVGPSIVEALNNIHVDSSFSYRERIAQVNNIQEYHGSAYQNDYMRKLLYQGRLIKP